jgi:hypothetical protein
VHIMTLVTIVIINNFFSKMIKKTFRMLYLKYE